MQRLREFLFRAVQVVVLSALAAGTFGIVVAWTGPSAAAPSNNVLTPINTGATAQTKSGGLTVGSLTTGGAVTATGNITGANVCLSNGICLKQNGYMFGGAYGWYPSGCYSNNPMTGSCTCPSPTAARLIIRSDYASTYVGAYTYICM